MESLLVSTALVAVAEIGDKTQLLALLLAAKFRKPIPIILGILVATLANHACAAGVGVWVSKLLDADTLRWILGGSFIAMAIWALVPDSAPDDDTASLSHAGIFVTTTIAFFLLEMGDKTQVATVALGAKYQSVWWVMLGSTLGMMIANVPAVLLGEIAAKAVPLHLVRIATAIIFTSLGIVTIIYGLPDMADIISKAGLS